MSAFFIFIFIMSFTPGPNTIMAMVSGQQTGVSFEPATQYMAC